MDVAEGTIARLQDWFAAQCDGYWEHGLGITVGTLDNPGWCATVHVAGTDLEDAPFEPLEVERSEEDWFHCRVEGGYFRGAGGARNLTEILTTFLAWSEGRRADRDPGPE